LYLFFGRDRKFLFVIEKIAVYINLSIFVNLIVEHGQILFGHFALCVASHKLPFPNNGEFSFNKRPVNTTVAINKIKKSGLNITCCKLIKESHYLSSPICDADLIAKNIKGAAHTPVQSAYYRRYSSKMRTRTVKFSGFQINQTDICLIEHLLDVVKRYDVIDHPCHFGDIYFSHMGKTWCNIDKFPIVPLGLSCDFPYGYHRGDDRRQIRYKLRKIFLNIKDNDWTER